MKPSNSLNVLPWYTSEALQNHKRSFGSFGIFALLSESSIVLPFQLRVSQSVDPLTSLSGQLLYADGSPTTVNINDWLKTLRKVDKSGYALLINDGINKIVPENLEGQFYINMDFSYTDTEGTTHEFTLTSDIFTFMSGTARKLKLVWWDNQDFVHVEGVIDYTLPYRNYVYLDTQVGKPEYVFEEDVSKRDGFNFVEKQISEKRCKFEFIAPEYLCDALRVVRMHDNITIINVDGTEYNADTFLLTPKWQEDGDIAVVETEFEFDTVIKKIAKTFSPSGDYNNDYNNDYY